MSTPPALKPGLVFGCLGFLYLKIQVWILGVGQEGGWKRRNH